MSKCLITKLKASIDGDIPVLDALKIQAKVTSTTNPYWGLIQEVSSTSFTVTSSDSFDVYLSEATWGISNPTLVGSNVKSFETQSGEKLYLFAPANDDAYHSFYINNKDEGKYGILCQTNNATVTGCDVIVDIDDLASATNVSQLHNLSCKSIGDLSSLAATKNALKKLSFKSAGANTWDGITGNIADVLTDSTTIVGFIGNTEVEIDLDTLAVGKSLTEIMFNRCPNAHGDVMTWANKLYNAGKTSGTITVNFVTTPVTVNGAAFGGSQRVLTFTAGGVTIS